MVGNAHKGGNIHKGEVVVMNSEVQSQYTEGHSAELTLVKMSAWKINRAKPRLTLECKSMSPSERPREHRQRRQPPCTPDYLGASLMALRSREERAWLLSRIAQEWPSYIEEPKPRREAKSSEPMTKAG